jgi:uncharacterized protein with HEPN domain
MSHRERQRLDDIQAAIEAIRSHLQRASLSVALVFDAVRIRLPGIGEAVKALPAELLGSQPGIPWGQIAGMRDHLAYRYFDTSHAILQATVDNDLPELEHAIRALAGYLRDDDTPGDTRRPRRPQPDAAGTRVRRGVSAETSLLQDVAH